MDDDCFLTKRSIRTIRVFWVCYARGPDFRAGGKLLFFGQVSRISAYALCGGCDSAKNDALDASVAAHIAENGSNQVFLRFL